VILEGKGGQFKGGEDGSKGVFTNLGKGECKGKKTL